MAGDQMPQGEDQGGPPKLGTAVLVVSLGLTALVTGLGYLSFRQRLDASELYPLPIAAKSSASRDAGASSAPANAETSESTPTPKNVSVVVPVAEVVADDPHKLTAALSVLMSVRSHIELYKLQHRDDVPDLIGRGWEPFLRRTAADGSVAEDGEFGPYFRATPVNPLNGLSRVTAVSAAAPDESPEVPDGGKPSGFLFNPASGLCWATDASGLQSMDESKARAIVLARRNASAPATPTPVPDARLSPQAKRTKLQVRLGMLRSQIELYKLQHHDRPPDLSAHPGWAQLMNRTRADGRVDSRGEYGPYLRTTLVNPLNGSSLVHVVKSLPADGATVRVGTGAKAPGFLYENPTGLVAGTDSRGAVVIDEDLAMTLRRRAPK
jgi:hypothetical protein